jgi:hypothetical protein
VQKRVLNHMECVDALVLHGLVRKLGAAHFGAAEKPDDNTVGVLKDAAGRPVLPIFLFAVGFFAFIKFPVKPYRNRSGLALTFIPSTSPLRVHGLLSGGTGLPLILSMFMQAVTSL